MIPLSVSFSSPLVLSHQIVFQYGDGEGKWWRWWGRMMEMMVEKRWRDGGSKDPSKTSPRNEFKASQNEFSPCVCGHCAGRTVPAHLSACPVRDAHCPHIATVAVLQLNCCNRISTVWLLKIHSFLAQNLRIHVSFNKFFDVCQEKLKHALDGLPMS